MRVIQIVQGVAFITKVEYTLEELMLTLLFVTFPVQSSVDPIYT